MPSRETILPELNWLEFYQNLTDLEKQKYPTPALSTFPDSPKRETDWEHLWRSQHGGTSQAHWQTGTKASKYKMLPLSQHLTTPSASLLYNTGRYYGKNLMPQTLFKKSLGKPKENRGDTHKKEIEGNFGLWYLQVTANNKYSLPPKQINIKPCSKGFLQGILKDKKHSLKR